MKLTGEKLRLAREERGLSLHEISLSLKINAKILKAIEDGQTENLPAKTFLRGFVQSYANYLNLNTVEILKLFQEEMGSTRPEPDPSLTEPAPLLASGVKTPREEASNAVVIEKVNERSRFKTIAISGAMAVLAALIYFINAKVEEYTEEAKVQVPIEDLALEEPISPESISPAKEASKHVENPPSISTHANPSSPTTAPAPQPPITSTPPGVTNLTPTLKQSPGATGTAAPTNPKSPAATAAPVAPVAPTHAAAPIAAPTAVSTAAAPPVAVPRASAPPAASTTLAAKPPSPVVPLPPTTITPAAKPPTPTVTTKNSAPNTTAPAPSGPLELIVEAIEAVEIQYSGEGSGQIQKILLSPEQVHTFKSSAGLSLNISNGGGVNLILNGKDLGVPGAKGQPIKLKY